MLLTNRIVGGKYRDSRVVVGQLHADLVVQGAGANVVDILDNLLDFGGRVERPRGAAVACPWQEVDERAVANNDLLVRLAERVPLATVVVRRGRAVLLRVSGKGWTDRPEAEGTYETGRAFAGVQESAEMEGSSR